ncbi:hypothetical protein MRY87_10930, partial [bacterium]|nr:hypothetical protein [bacterium]
MVLIRALLAKTGVYILGYLSNLERTAEESNELLFLRRRFLLSPFRFPVSLFSFFSLSSLLLGVSGILFCGTFFLSSGGSELEELRSQRRLQLSMRDRLSRRVSDLQSRLVGMEKSPRVLEKTAREELHLVH